MNLKPAEEWTDELFCRNPAVQTVPAIRDAEIQRCRQIQGDALKWAAQQVQGCEFCSRQRILEQANKLLKLHEP